MQLSDDNLQKNNEDPKTNDWRLKFSEANQNLKNKELIEQPHKNQLKHEQKILQKIKELDGKIQKKAFQQTL